MKYKNVKKIFIFLFLTFVIFPCSAQFEVVGPANEFKIGDRIPDLVFDTIINYPKTSVKLSDFRGKLVILDLWTTACGPCIGDLPRKQKIQEEFKEDIVILPITFFTVKLDDSIASKWKRQTIPDFWKSNTITKQLKLPTIIDSKNYIASNFSVKPGLQIWIDKNGILRGLTHDEYVNSKEIKKILNNEAVDWAVWKRVKIDQEKPLIAATASQVKYSDLEYSVFMPHLKYVSEFLTATFDTSFGRKRFTAINLPILAFFAFAYNKYGNVCPYSNRIVAKVKDSSKLFKQNNYYEDWWVKNSYCYEKVSSLQKPDSIFAKEMLWDLKQHLGLSSSIVLKKVKCQVVKSVRNKFTREEILNMENKSYRSCSIEEFVHNLNSDYSKSVPIIYNPSPDQKFNRKIYLQAIDWTNNKEVQQLLKSNGLKVEDSVMNIPMFVISDD